MVAIAIYLDTAVYSETSTDSVTLLDPFRSKLGGFEHRIADTALDCCAVIGINNNLGCRLYSSVAEFMRRV